MPTLTVKHNLNNGRTTIVFDVWLRFRLLIQPIALKSLALPNGTIGGRRFGSRLHHHLQGLGWQSPRLVSILTAAASLQFSGQLMLSDRGPVLVSRTLLPMCAQCWPFSMARMLQNAGRFGGVQRDRVGCTDKLGGFHNQVCKTPICRNVSNASHSKKAHKNHMTSKMPRRILAGYTTSVCGSW